MSRRGNTEATWSHGLITVALALRPGLGQAVGVSQACGSGAMVRYAILGSVELCDGERRVGVGGPRQVALLALLLVNANRALSTDRLIDALWHDRDAAGSLKRLRMAIARLRGALDPGGVQGESVLRTTAGGYLLAVRPGELDADVFQARVVEGRSALESGEAAHAHEVLVEALGMWHGPALADVAYEKFAQPEIRRLEELRLVALETSVDCDLRLGRHAGVIGELEALMAAHPGRERLVAQLMLALYRCGRQGDALTAYARARAYLATELGLEPGPALQALQGEILDQSPTLQPVTDEPDGGSSVGCRPVMLPLPRALRVPPGSVFVGRDLEFTRLRRRWAHTGSGAGSVVMIGGEPGIGKTRLAAEFAHAMHEQGALVLHGRCDEGLAVPYQPFVEALRPYARAAGVDRLHVDLGDLAPELGRLLPELAALGQPIRADPESERFAMFEATAALIEAMTYDQPALVVLDDLHWATNPTLLLLRHLMRSERPLAVMILCTYRETEFDLGQPLAQLLANLQGDSSAERLSLRGLNDSAITALVQAAVGHALDDRTPQLARVLGAQTAGNPFFVRELLADVTQADVIYPASDRLSLDAMATRLQIPEGLRYVIGQRVARLPAPARRLLNVAAVAGATSSFVLLEHVLGEQSGVLDALDQAVAAGLLIEAEHGDYVFSHALVRQTIYGQLSKARRMRLHRQLGEALEALDDTEAHVEALAYHFAQAAADGQSIKAADYGLAAGRSATGRLGYEEAAAHYQRALQSLALGSRSQAPRCCELLLALGEACWGAGQLDQARQAYSQAAELAEQLGDATALARAALGFCGPYFEVALAVTRPRVDMLERALVGMGDGDSPLRAQLLSRLAIYVDEGGLAFARQAVEMARRVADRLTLADVLWATYTTLNDPATPQRSLAVADELGCAADGIGEHRLRALAHGCKLQQLLELGDTDAVERELEALQRLTRSRKVRHLTWMLTMIQVGLAYLEGRLEDCEAIANHTLAHGLGESDETAAQVFAAQMLAVRGEQGRLDELVETVQGYAARYPAFIHWRCAMTSIHARLNEKERAREQLNALAHADFTDFPRDTFWLGHMFGLGEVVSILGDAARAQLLYLLLTAYGDRYAVPFPCMCQGSVSRSLGLLATTLSRYDDARRHFEHALMMNARIRSPLWIARTQHDYARMLLLRDDPGDHDRALELLDDALEAAQRLGLKALGDEARALKQAG
jgi:DNA-binding SARP family transcriptional activator